MFGWHLFFVYCWNAVAEIRFASEGSEKKGMRMRENKKSFGIKDEWKTTDNMHIGTMDIQTEYFIANIKYRYRLIPPNVQYTYHLCPISVSRNNKNNEISNRKQNKIKRFTFQPHPQETNKPNSVALCIHEAKVNYMVERAFRIQMVFVTNTNKN